MLLCFFNVSVACKLTHSFIVDKMAELFSAPQFLTIEKWLFEQIIQHGQRWRSIVVTVKQSRELWKSEFLPAIKSEIEAVKVQLHTQITIINERLQNIEQTQSLLLCCKQRLPFLFARRMTETCSYFVPKKLNWMALCNWCLKCKYFLHLSIRLHVKVLFPFFNNKVKNI